MRPVVLRRRFVVIGELDRRGGVGPNRNAVGVVRNSGLDDRGRDVAGGGFDVPPRTWL